MYDNIIPNLLAQLVLYVFSLEKSDSFSIGKHSLNFLICKSYLMEQIEKYKISTIGLLKGNKISS